MNSAVETALWKEIRCASLPIAALETLADLRGRAEIEVALSGGRAWVYWRSASGVVPELLARRILSVRGVELFTMRAGEWYGLGKRLPAFDVPFRHGATGVPLETVVVPGKLSVLRSGSGISESLRVRIVPAADERAHPATAFRCALRVLGSWAERATSAQLGALRGAWRAGTDDDAANAEVFVMGAPSRLPLLPESTRYWGTGLLIPLGFRAEPDLPEAAIRGAAEAGPGDLAVLDDGGLELITLDLFQPLTRASIRLGLSAPAVEGGHRT